MTRLHVLLFFLGIFLVTLGSNHSGNGIVSGDNYNPHKMLREFDNLDSWELLSHGVDYLNRNVLDSAYVCFAIVKTRTERYTDEEERAIHISSLDGLGIVSFLFGNYSKSYDMFNQTIEINPNHTKAYLNLANIYQTFGEHERAREYLEKAYEKFLSNGEIDAMSIAISDIFEYDIINDATAKSRNLATNFLKLDFDSVTQPLKYARLLGEGLVAIDNKDSRKAVSLFRNCFDVIDDAPVFMKSRFTTVTQACLARAFDKAGNSDSAIFYMRSAFHESLRDEHRDLTISTGRNLGTLFDKRHMSDSANYYRYRALSLADSISTYSEYGKIKGMEMQKKIDDAQDDIERYRSESKSRNLIITIMAIALAIIIALLLWILRKNRELHKKDLHLYEAYASDHKERKEIASDAKAETIEDVESEEDNSIEKKEYSNIISEEYGNRLMEKIEKFMSGSTDWKKPKFSLSNLADSVNDTPRNVSQIINERCSKNFSSYVNEHRIKACISYLQDNPDSLNYTIDAIASEFGFTSRSYFTRVFQSVVGMPPSSWMKIMREKEDGKIV